MQPFKPGVGVYSFRYRYDQGLEEEFTFATLAEMFEFLRIINPEQFGKYRVVAAADGCFQEISRLEE